MESRRNKFLDDDTGDESSSEQGYDSEAAEQFKGSRSNAGPTKRPSKRRRLSPAVSGKEEKYDLSSVDLNDESEPDLNPPTDTDEQDDSNEVQAERAGSKEAHTTVDTAAATRRKAVVKKKTKRPGVIYMSSLPPYLRPSALRNLLLVRGFQPITRLFLTPASKARPQSSRSSRQRYTEGWIEFASKTVARRCAEALNATPVGGKKGGFYYDDVWNMKYLRGMGWDELMAGVREERREEEGRRDEERRRITRETKVFVESVEEGKRVEGIRKKRLEKGKRAASDHDDGSGANNTAVHQDETRWAWRQNEVKNQKTADGRIGRSRQKMEDGIDEDAKRVLAKIF